MHCVLLTNTMSVGCLTTHGPRPSVIIVLAYVVAYIFTEGALWLVLFSFFPRYCVYVSLCVCVCEGMMQRSFWCLHSPLHYIYIILTFRNWYNMILLVARYHTLSAENDDPVQFQKVTSNNNKIASIGPKVFQISIHQPCFVNTSQIKLNKRYILSVQIITSK